ncbi:MAG: DUF3592 domain-containing protein [Ruminococcus sp.]|nr:DUF3592 domain-containing protein [Ruminococcus sp.]CDE33589.1 putative uncharacterized protein [Ruminococcus sp. CAG:403]
MTTELISCIAVGGAGILMMLFSLFFFLREKRIQKACTQQTVGTVIQYRYGGGTNGKSIAPVVTYEVGNRTYKAYRHYKGVASARKQTPNPNTCLGQKDCCWVSDREIFHIHTTGVYHHYAALARETWPLGSQLPVVYNPKNPKQAFVEKVVVCSKLVGIVLLCCGGGLVLIAGIAYVLFR